MMWASPGVVVTARMCVRGTVTKDSHKFTPHIVKSCSVIEDRPRFRGFKMRWYLSVFLVLLAGCASSQLPKSANTQPAAVVSPATAQPSQVGIGKITLGMPLRQAMGFFSVPDRSGTDDKGAAYHAYQVSPSGGYVVLMTATYRPDFIFGVQIAGGADVDMTPIMGVRLGDTIDKVLANVGAPSEKTAVQGMDRTLWSYDDRNYSFEIDSSGHL